MLAQLAGDTAQGVTFLTRLVFGINANACKEGIRQCGAAVFSKLDASQTPHMGADYLRLSGYK
jgi:hypothetical protein